jgi:hypothetical protein
LHQIDEFLRDGQITSNPWLAEQTLHALCASQAGTRLLPDTYLLSRGPGLVTPAGVPLTCKHYPNAYRHLMFEEGMQHLVSQGFLQQMGARC